MNMNKNFTPEDLIQFIYHELSEDKAKAVQQAIDADWTLREKYQVLKAAYDRLEKMPLLAPRSEVLHRILDYAVAEQTQSQ